MFSTLRNWTVNIGKYKEHPEAIIISCFFNPQNSPYRLKAFKIWYDSIKHLNHQIVECVIGDSKPQLPENENITRIYTENLLWHKESLLNLMVTKLPARYKYVFWVDADVIFTNLNWLTRSVEEFKSGAAILQPFEYCVHLGQDETKPNFDYNKYKNACGTTARPKTMWRSFGANCATNKNLAASENYDNHGHVGFAWGARREVLEKCPLYDRALIGGADHIIAHAAMNQIPSECINKSFTENLDEVYEWSKKFYKVAKGRVGYVTGDLFHIWHGDIDKRQYLKRIKEFTPTTKAITKKDPNGLYVTSKGDDTYIKRYFAHREVPPKGKVYNVGSTKPYTGTSQPVHNDGFLDSMMMGYMTDSTLMGTLYGGNPMGAMIGAGLRPNNNQNSSDGYRNTPGGNQINYPADRIAKPEIQDTRNVPMYDGPNENFS